MSLCLQFGGGPEVKSGGQGWCVRSSPDVGNVDLENGIASFERIGGMSRVTTFYHEA